MSDSNRELKQENLQQHPAEPTLWTYAKAHPLSVAIAVPAGLAIGALCGIEAGPIGILLGALIGAVIGALIAGGKYRAAGGRSESWTRQRRDNSPPAGEPPPQRRG